MIISTPWFKYERTGSGYAPFVRTSLSVGATEVGPLPFLIDTGAAFSFVPRFLVRKLLVGLPEQEEQPSGANDASGNPIWGLPVEVGIRLMDARKFPKIRERIWVSRTVSWQFLGQTWLEKLGAHFQNFPESSQGRRFALYLSPYLPDAPGR